MSIRRQPRPRVSKAGLFLSLVFHLAAIGLLVLLAAREGLFGLTISQGSISNMLARIGKPFGAAAESTPPPWAPAT